MTMLLRTAADFDALPDRSLIVAVQVPNSRTMLANHRLRTVWQKYGQGFVKLDPADRNNGEESHPSLYLENLLKSFGSHHAVPGVAVLLDGGDQIAADSADDLATRSIVIVAGDEYPHLHHGGGKWEYLDPNDPAADNYISTETLTSEVVTIQVLYRPGDDVLAGFDPFPSEDELSEEVEAQAPAQRLLRTEADFAAVPDDAFVLTIEVIFPDVPHGRARTLWHKFSDFVKLDPSDRGDGDESKPAGYLAATLTRFGAANTIPGVGVLLPEGDLIAPDQVAGLPIGSIVLVDSCEMPHTYAGNGNWTFMDPSDVYDGDYPTTTENLISGENIIHVLYRPGDEERLGFDPNGEATTEPAGPLSVAEVVERAIGRTVTPPEHDIDAMSPCAQAYIAEYGSLPKGRAEQDRYGVFRFGYERGNSDGHKRAYADIANYARART